MSHSPKGHRSLAPPPRLQQIVAALRERKDGRRVGSRQRMRAAFGYSPVSECYHMLIDLLVTPGSRWLDVGGGKTIFPDDPRWAAELASRCGKLIAVDPSETVLQNTVAHEQVQCLIEDYRTSEVFDLATLRMVAEHVEQPARVVSALRTLVAPGGVVVVLTPNRWSPASIAAAIVPNSLHPLFTQWLSGREAEDTFPTLYLMNTRRDLREAFERDGFKERAFWNLADLSLLQRHRPLLLLQLVTWRALAWLRVNYPENVLLGLYERVDGPN